MYKCNNVGNWFCGQFRGFSIMHFMLSGALTWIVGFAVGPLATFTPAQVILLCLGVLVASIAIISLWLRRNEGMRESRFREQPGIREDVRQGYRALAKQARSITSPDEVGEFRDALLARMEVHFNEAMIVPYRQLLDGIEDSTTLTKRLMVCSSTLDAMIDSLHYSDIKRHPLE